MQAVEAQALPKVRVFGLATAFFTGSKRLLLQQLPHLLQNLQNGQGIRDPHGAVSGEGGETMQGAGGRKKVH